MRDRNKIRRPDRLTYGNIVITEHYEAENYDDAITCSNAIKWKEAMDDEIDSLRKTQTWTLVNPPSDHQVIDNRWTYKLKINSDGNIQRFKARLVARGFKQTAGVEYHETFSPVARFDSIRTILSITASNKMYLQQFDVKTAFLHGELDEVIYMQQPKGYEDGTNRVCKLNRSLYGLKQASRCWNHRFTAVLKKHGLTSTNADYCVFTNGNDRDRLILAIHIDDGLISATNQSSIKKVVS